MKTASGSSGEAGAWTTVGTSGPGSAGDEPLLPEHIRGQGIPERAADPRATAPLVHDRAVGMRVGPERIARADVVLGVRVGRTVERAAMHDHRVAEVLVA